MNFNNMQWFDHSILIFGVMSFILNGLIAYLWHKKFYRNLGLKTYQAVQRIHLDETPRLGGLVFILSLISCVMYCQDNESIFFLKLILICLTPIILFGLKEDLFHNVDPVVRLISILLVGWIFIAKFTGPLPHLAEVPLISKLLILQGGVSLFYILGMTAVANGMNLIDGVNGLCGAVALSMLSSLLFLSYKTSDIVIMSTILIVILIFIPFMILNYPYGKIFLGDLGAYTLGLIVSMLIIIFFGRHPEISPWVATLILIYPVTEIVFSLLRRILKGASIFHPDTAHLHLKLFYFLRPIPHYKKMANALVTPILSILWMLPLLVIPWVYQKTFYIFISCIFFIMLYFIIYVFMLKVQKNKNG